MCHFAASSQVSLWTAWLLEVWRQVTSASKGWSQIVCVILYYTNQDIISEKWKPILPLKVLESFDIFRLVVVYIFPIVDFFFLSQNYSVLSFSSFLENNIFLIWTREFTIVPLAVHLEMILSVGVGGLQRQRKHQEEVKERIHNKSFHFVSSNQGK